MLIRYRCKLRIHTHHRHAQIVRTFTHRHQYTHNNTHAAWSTVPFLHTRARAHTQKHTHTQTHTHTHTHAQQILQFCIPRVTTPDITRLACLMCVYKNMHIHILRIWICIFLYTHIIFIFLYTHIRHIHILIHTHSYIHPYIHPHILLSQQTTLGWHQAILRWLRINTKLNNSIWCGRSPPPYLSSVAKLGSYIVWYQVLNRKCLYLCTHRVASLVASLFASWNVMKYHKMWWNVMKCDEMEMNFCEETCKTSHKQFCKETARKASWNKAGVEPVHWYRPLQTENWLSGTNPKCRFCSR